jgi:hypothetical protein
MNFILIDYKHAYQSDNLINYYHHHDKFFLLAVRQIKKIYHDAVIHVITNRPQKKDGLLYHYFPNLENNNYAKLHIFDLLDEPALYMDTDVLLLKRFENLPDVECFNLFQEYKNSMFLPEHMQGYTHYNTGIVWIPQPSKEIAEEIKDAKDKFLIHKNGWLNDEYPISWIVNKLKLKMITSKHVNCYRSSLSCFNEVLKNQSVHYTGSKYYKNLLLEEYRFLKIKL